jgi:hypothetical protein
MARMPKTKSVSAWASFLKEEDLSVASAIDRTTSFSMKEWLRENTFKIIEAIEKEEATATFITEAKIIEEPEKEVKSKPVKGVRV